MGIIIYYAINLSTNMYVLANLKLDVAFLGTKIKSKILDMMNLLNESLILAADW